MLSKVREQRPSYNNADAITSSVSVSQLKLAYYTAFAWAYCFVGSYADSVAVNSCWTKAHIAERWGFLTASAERNTDLHLIYPPCNTTDLHAKMVLRREARVNGERLVVSIGQFRPEKDHYLQIR